MNILVISFRDTILKQIFSIGMWKYFTSHARKIIQLGEEMHYRQIFVKKVSTFPTVRRRVNFLFVRLHGILKYLSNFESPLKGSSALIQYFFFFLLFTKNARHGGV